MQYIKLESQKMLGLVVFKWIEFLMISRNLTYLKSFTLIQLIYQILPNYIQKIYSIKYL